MNCSARLPLRRYPFLWIAALLSIIPQADVVGDDMLNLKLQSRNAQNNGLQHEDVKWDPQKTAVVICDMWDDHWCQGAAGRVVEMAKPMNQLVEKLRAKGALIVHAPSSVVDFYEGTPQRQRAQKAPFAKAPIELSTAERWGTFWCWPDPTKEPDLPIDDSDMGCDCATPCKIREAWTRQINLIGMNTEDAITDNGQEFFNLLESREIDNILIMGVHLNMCVLGRPFGIRQSTRLGKNVVLIRDMTDSMYNHRKRPFVDHFSGHDLVVQHVEKYWCPTITSDQIAGESAFRFSEDKRTEP